MTPLAALWLPVLASAALVFVVSSLLHMVVQWHKHDYARLRDEDGFLEQLRARGITPGQYMFPSCESMKELGSPEMQAKFTRGPIGALIVRPAGGIGMGKALLQWFVLCVVVSVFVAYLTGLSLAPAAEGARVFRIATTVALLGHGFSSVTDSIWKGISWSVTGRFMIDGVLYALTTGATFAWLWPTA